MTRTAVRTRRLTSNISTVSSWAAWPLDQPSRRRRPQRRRQGPCRVPASSRSPSDAMTCSRRLYAAADLAVPGERMLDRAPVAEELDRAAVRAPVDVHVHVRHGPGLAE